VTISIPKLVNASELFHDDANSGALKNALAGSINQSALNKETKSWELLYNGSLIANSAGEDNTSVTADQKTQIIAELRKQLETQTKYRFKEWVKFDQGDKNVRYEKNADGIVTISGTAWTEEHPNWWNVFTTTKIDIKAKFNFVDSTYRFQAKSLKVRQVD
jgi:hypothetical protein